MQIHIEPAHGRGRTTTHIDGQQVTITEAFIGPLFVTDNEEHLVVCMRESGYEITYAESDVIADDAVWIQLDRGRVTPLNEPARLAMYGAPMAPPREWAPTRSIEALCETMHEVYEEAARQVGWETQERSRVGWDELPEENRETMRAAMQALLDQLGYDAAEYPHPDGDHTVIGPECFTDGRVICWKGENFYRDPPLLGFATTRQLLEEVEARARLQADYAAEDRMKHQILAQACRDALEFLRPWVLDYRTIDGKMATDDVMRGVTAAVEQVAAAAQEFHFVPADEAALEFAIYDDPEMREPQGPPRRRRDDIVTRLRRRLARAIEVKG